MPVDNSWDNIGIPEDSRITTQFIATVKAFLCMLEMERQGILETSVVMNEDALMGLVFRSKRMNIQQPEDSLVIGTAIVVAEKLNITNEDKEMFMVLMAAEILPELNIRLDAPL